jgi:cytochrome c-type biogenesis protein CcmE
MTTAAAGFSWRGRGRAPFLLLGLVLVVALVVIATSGFKSTLTYYKTPTDLVTNPPASNQRLRLGGLVESGTISHHGATVRFTLTDGAQEVEVVSTGTPPQTFRAGQGAVVEGVLGNSGVFRADTVIVRHDNQYQPPGTDQ